MSTKSNPKLKQVNNVLEKKPTKTKLKLYETITSRRRRELHFGSSSSDTKVKNNEVGGGRNSQRSPYTTTTYPTPSASPYKQKRSGHSHLMVRPSSNKKPALIKDTLSSAKIYLNQVKLPLMIKLDWRTSKYVFVEMDSQFPDVEEMTKYYPNYDGDVERSYTKLTCPDAHNCCSGRDSRKGKLKVPKSIKIARIFDPYLKFWPIEIDQEAIDLMDQHLREQIEPKLPSKPPQSSSMKNFGPGLLMRWA